MNNQEDLLKVMRNINSIGLMLLALGLLTFGYFFFQYTSSFAIFLFVAAILFWGTLLV